MSFLRRIAMRASQGARADMIKLERLSDAQLSDVEQEILQLRRAAQRSAD